MHSWTDIAPSSIDVRGGRLAYYRTGRGPHLVLVHGWPLHAATFRHVVPLLADRYTLHMFDLPGTGRTQWSGPLSFGASAEALAEALYAIDLDAYAIFGHDSGGAIARRIAASDARVRGLILEDTEIPHHRTPLLLALVALFRAPFAARVFPWALQRGAFRRSIFGFGSCFADPSYVDGDFADLFVRPLARPEISAPQMALGRSFDLAFVDALADVHRAITVPTVCIWGERDPYFRVDAARAMTRELPRGTRLVTIPRARLLPHEDHPRDVADAIRAFMERAVEPAPS